MIKTSVKKRITLFAVVLLVAVFFVYQIIIWILNGVITTEVAISYTVYDEITADALFIRNEMLIERAYNGVYNFSISNGEKVSNGGVIANVFNDEISAETEIKLQKLKKQREELVAIQNTGTSYFADIDLINSKIDTDIISIIELIHGSKDLDSTLEYTEDLLKQFNKKQVSTGFISNFNSLISEIDRQIDELEATVSAPVSSVYSPESGYFVNSVDGYESVFLVDDFANFNVSEFENLQNSEKVATENYIGKVIIGNSWNAACVVEASKASMINIGDEIMLNIPQISVSDISAQIVAKNTDESTGKVVIVIECDEITDEIVDLRFESISIHANHYSGLRVSREAIRIVDGNQGVYILSENEAKFKQIDIIFSSVDFVICKVEDKNNALLLYDEIITEGSNLYDGKVIK